MATQDYAQLIRDLYRLGDNRELDKIAGFFTPNAEFRVIGSPEEPMRGTKEIVEGFKEWQSTFPDLKNELKNVIAAGDFVVVEGVARGTHKGPMRMPEGTLPASNHKIEVQFCDVFHLKGGKIESWKCYWDSMTMLNQLGIELGKAAA